MLGIFNKQNTGKVINVNDIDNLLGKVELIDIREPFEHKKGAIKTSKNIPMGEITENPEKYLEKEKEYYIVCQSGGRSARTCKALTSKGFNVIDVAGGYGSYLGTNRK